MSGSSEEGTYTLAMDGDPFESIESLSDIATATATGSTFLLTIIFPSVFFILILGLSLVTPDGDEEKKSLKTRFQQTSHIFSL